MTLNARSTAALAGAGVAAWPVGGGEVDREVAVMLLSGVAAPAEEVIELIDRATTAAVVGVAAGVDPVTMIAGAMLETFVLGALVGLEEDGGS